MKKLFSLLLVTLMLLSPFAMCVNAESVTEQAVQVKDTNEQKITSDLQAHLDTVDDDEYVPVYVWLNDYGEDMLYEVLSQRLGKTVTADTEEAYIKEKVDIKEKLLSKGLENLAKTNEYKLQSMSQGVMDIRNLTGNTFKAQANLSGIMTDEEIDTCIESNMTSSEIIELSERNQFLSDYRQSRKTVNTAVNTTFYNSLDLDECRNVYLDPALAYASMECKKSYIEDLKKLSIVNQIGIFGESSKKVFKVSNHQTGEQETVYDNYEMLAQETLGYDGSGVRVGVIEVNVPKGQENTVNDDGIVYDSNNPHLLSKASNNKLFTNLTFSGLQPLETGQISYHATAVLSVLCGDPVMYGGKTYQGVAPNATVYYYSLKKGGTNVSFYRVIASLVFVDNVSIINMSLNSETFYYEQDFDGYLDCFIQDYRVAFVICAGNDGAIGAPAWTYNAIAVGNASCSTDDYGKYLMHHSSAYSSNTYSFDEYSWEALKPNYLTNKPDISAFGTNITMINSNGVPSNQFAVDTQDGTVTGTSFSAPYVTGTIALMLQANPSLVGKPDAIKTILLVSANEEAISFEDNEIISHDPSLDPEVISAVGSMRKKSGAGLLNVASAIRLANSEELYRFTCVTYSPDNRYLSAEYFFYAGTEIEIGLVFEKATHDRTSAIGTQYHGTDLEIQILDRTGAAVFSSTSPKDNVEIFKCTIEESGDYIVQVKVDSLSTINYGNNTDFYDEDGNIITHNDHTDNTYASMILTCSCPHKNISLQDTFLESHDITCSAANCNFDAKVRYKVSYTTVFQSNGIMVVPVVAWLFGNDQTTGNREFRSYNLDFFGTPENSSIAVHYVGIDSYNLQITPTGETRYYTLEAIIEQNGELQTIYAGSFRIIIDYFERTVVLEE